MKRVVIVASSQSYRTGDFLSAARLLGVEPIVVSDGEPTLPGAQVRIDLADPDGAVEAIRALEPTPDAVIAIDDQGVSLAARASRKLGLATNPAQAVAATRNKLLMRRLFEDRDVAQPRFAQVDVGEGADLATDLGFPVVLKPAGLSASRGVIRADDPASARRAERRIRTILADSGLDADQPLLVEEYLSGAEVAVEGIVVDGSLEVLAIIDKPDSMDGPFFEETMLVTPSRLPPAAQEDAIALTTAGIGALGLVSGPVHAEIRADDDGSVRLLELAARSIGGLCGRAFTFGLVGEALEVLVLRSALGLPTFDTKPARPAVGVLMIPIPGTGRFSGIGGVAEALTIDGIDDVTITVAPGRRVVALPEGDRYLGFVFGSGLSPARVESALREAASTLTVVVDGEEMSSVVSPPG